MERKSNFTTAIVQTAIIAAVYAVLTVIVTPFMSYGAIQFRIAEILTLLCFYSRKHCPALILGCFIANLFSPLGLIDLIAGTSATAASVILMSRVKNIWIASLFPVIVNGLIVGAELSCVFATPFWLNVGYVAFGEFVVITVIGVPLFKFIVKNTAVKRFIVGGAK